MAQLITLERLDDDVIPAAMRAMWLPLSVEARVGMLAIAGQESGLSSRVQILASGGRGPAMGLWQFERGGGVRGVMQHSRTTELLRMLCRSREVAFDEWQIWMALEHDDVMAAGLARLLLLTDPTSLPALGDQAGMWACYLRTWRPGKPHQNRWPANYSAALRQVTKGKS